MTRTPRGLNQLARDEMHRRAIHEFSIERYRYILSQISALNENVYRFLAIYQALATTTVGAAILLFVNYKRWGMEPGTARVGVLSLLVLETIVAAFTALLILVGVLSWIDYRREECELTDVAVALNFRKAPNVGNFFRWYETYIIAFIMVSAIVMWIFAYSFIFPRIK